MTKGIINKILVNSSVDGMGNRGVVFLQGCNINCIYCHNPETINHCINCGVCVSKCPVDALMLCDGAIKWSKELCVNCDTCISVCPHSASPKIMVLTAGETMEYFLPYADFMRGITVSGGECTLQQDYVRELFILAKSMNKHTLIDTNGSNFMNEDLLSVTDGVMIDIKDIKNPQSIACDSFVNLHKNFKQLLEQGKIYEIRHVMLEGITATMETIDYIADMTKAYRETPLKLIRFRPHGTRMKETATCSLDYAEKMKEYAKRRGMKNIVIT